MNNRLQQFLDLENLTPARLADILGVQRSGLSHILSGRNKPSFEFCTKLLTKFPRVNADWLLLGKGKPYKDLNADSQFPPQNFNGNFSPFDGNNIAQNNLNNQQSNNQHLFKQPLNEQQLNSQYLGNQSLNNQYSNGQTYSNVQLNNQYSNGQQLSNQYLQDPYNTPILDSAEIIENESNTFENGKNNGQNTTNENINTQNEQSKVPENQINAKSLANTGKKKAVKRVIIYYSDGTFDELFPQIR